MRQDTQESLKENQANFSWNNRNLLWGVLVGALIAILAYTVVVTVLNRSSSEGNADNTENTSSEASVESQDAVTNVSFLVEELERVGRSLPLKEVSLRLNTLSVSQLQNLLDRSIAMDTSTKIYSMQELLLEALARLSPSRALDKIWDFPSARWKELIPIAFGEWAVMDFEKALEQAHELPLSFKEQALRSILAAGSETLSSSSQNALTNGDLYRVVQENNREAELAEMIEHPDQAWNHLVHDEVLNASQQAHLVQIAEAWVLKDGYGVLMNIFNDLHQVHSSLFEEILMKLAKHDPGRVFQLITDMPLEVRSNVAAPMLGLWARRDPNQAMEATGLLEHQQVRWQAQLIVTYRWAQDQPRDLLGSLTLLPAETRKLAVQLALQELAESAPREAVLLLHELESKSSLIEDEAYFALVEGWSQSDSAGAISWVLESSAEGSELRARMLQRALAELAHIDPQEAMHIALSQEPHPFHRPRFFSGSMGLEYYVIESMVSQGNVDEALVLLNQVRDGSKPWVFGVVGSKLIESRRTSEALDLAEQLAVSDQQRYLRSLVPSWLTVNRTELLETLESLPTKSVQQAVAMEILRHHGFGDNELSVEQISFVQSFLAESTTSNTSAE